MFLAVCEGFKKRRGVKKGRSGNENNSLKRGGILGNIPANVTTNWPKALDTVTLLAASSDPEILFVSPMQI